MLTETSKGICMVVDQTSEAEVPWDLLERTKVAFQVFWKCLFGCLLYIVGLMFG